MPFLATMRRLPIVFVVVGPLLYASEAFKAPFPPYTLVNCCDLQGMRVFPFDGIAFTVPLPFVSRVVAFSPNGNALYAIKPPVSGHQTDPGGSVMMKIEFHPTRMSSVFQSSDLEISSFAVSTREDRLIVAGRSRNRAVRTCGLFEISLPGGNVRRILESSDCSYGTPWNEVSLSSDGDRAVANNGRDSDLIDLVHGTVTPLGSEFSRGTWASAATLSPDGKRIAVMESASRGRVFLLDPSDLSRQRVLHGGSHRMAPVWSPDSRYLVRSRLQLRCGIGVDLDPPFTLEIVDIERGKRALLKSSKCTMNGAGTGWLSTDLIR